MNHELASQELEDHHQGIPDRMGYQVRVLDDRVQGDGVVVITFNWEVLLVVMLICCIPVSVAMWRMPKRKKSEYPKD